MLHGSVCFPAACSFFRCFENRSKASKRWSHCRPGSRTSAPPKPPMDSTPSAKSQEPSVALKLLLLTVAPLLPPGHWLPAVSSTISPPPPPPPKSGCEGPRAECPMGIGSRTRVASFAGDGRQGPGERAGPTLIRPGSRYPPKGCTDP